MAIRSVLASFEVVRIRVALVAGAYPPRQCGAEDYTVRLAGALENDGVEARIFAGGWHALRAPVLKREILLFHPHVLHIQYPTMGYGKGLVPQILSGLILSTPVVTTLHEFSTSHLLRKVADLPFAVRSRALVFTTEYERQRFSSWFPWTARRSLVVPIGSNMPSASGSVVRDPSRVVYFGLIRPNKGLEDFLKLARLAKDKGRPYKFAIVGEVAARYGFYPEKLEANADDLPIEWKIGSSAEEASRYLAGCRFSYMPFPDGASERRGSLLGVMRNGAVVITTSGPQTTDALRKATFLAEDPGQALCLLDELSSDFDGAEDMSSRSVEYARRFSWESISEAHQKLYRQISNV